MADEVALPTGQGPETAAKSEAPTDFREFAKWRATGELPEQEAQAPAAAEEPPAKTEPDPEPDDDQEAEEQKEEQQDADASTAGKGRGGSRQRRIDRLTRENEELKRQIAGKAEPQDKPSEPATGKPKLEDFQTLEQYQEALTDWKLDQREQQRKEAEARTAAEEAVRKEQETWAKREKAARKAHDDYDDLMETVQIPAGPGVLAARQAMLEDDNGAEMLYYLAKHPAELERIAGLSPASAILAIGKLSASLTPATDNGKPRITGAPKPPPPSGRPTRTVSDSVDDPAVQNDFKRWAKAREAQIKGR
jgi:hypothetical protein